MRDVSFVAFPLRLHLAGIGQAGFLLHRQGIEFGADHHHRAGAVVIDRDDAGSANAFGHFKAERAHLAREFRGGARLLMAEFGMLVNVFVDVEEVRVVRADFGFELRLYGGDIERQRGRGERKNSGCSGCSEQRRRKTDVHLESP